MSPCSRRTHLPSFRSMAGISSMARPSGAVSLCVGWFVVLVGLRWRGAREPRRFSRHPGEEVPIQGQTVGGALLWVELGGKNVIARHSAGKAPAVFAVGGAVTLVRR